jgi:hypothetical protein
MSNHSIVENGTKSTTSEKFSFCGNRIPKNQFTYISQIIIIYAIVVTSIVHLSIQSPNRELWLILLSSSLGYILPSPGLKYIKPNQSQFDFIDGKK